MSKIIIPNAAFEPSRFLWMIDTGDIILLDKMPSKSFIDYLCQIKNIDINSFTIVITSELAGILEDGLIKKIKSMMGEHHKFTLWCYFLNETILEFANRLAISVDDRLQQLVKNNILEKLNHKTEFRQLAAQYNIPHPTGILCDSEEALTKCILKYVSQTGKIIIKQPFASGGLGNIGISNEEYTFFGVHKSYLINEDNIHKIAREIWLHYTDSCNARLIIEVYYPHTKTITAILNIDEHNQIQLVNTGIIYFVESHNHQQYKNIKLASSIAGIQMPAVGLTDTVLLNLLNYSYIVAQQIQQSGYIGLLSVDAILTENQDLIFTEVNVRNGGETHINYLINQLFTQSKLPFNNSFAMLSTLENFALSLDEALKILAQHHLLFNQAQGVIIINLNHSTQKLLYVVLAQNKDQLNELQKKLANVSFCKEG